MFNRVQGSSWQSCKFKESKYKQSQEQGSPKPFCLYNLFKKAKAISKMRTFIVLVSCIRMSMTILSGVGISLYVMTF